MATPNDFQRHVIFQSMVGRLRASGMGRSMLTSPELAQQEEQNWRHLEQPFSNSTFQAIARRARESVLLAESLQNNPTAVPTRGQTPSDVGIDPARPRYLYQVVISVDGADGRSAETRIDYRSDTPLSFNSVAEAASQEVQSPGSEGRTEVASILTANPGSLTQIYLVSVSRR